VHYSDSTNLRKAGAAVGYMWPFVQEIRIPDLVVVPHGPSFYIVEIVGEAIFDEETIGDDSAYRRDVNWLNSKNPIPRDWAKSTLISRMKTQGTRAEG
jgi:predicted Mrr-cat superfamily restriction endonuclease